MKEERTGKDLTCMECVSLKTCSLSRFLYYNPLNRTGACKFIDLRIDDNKERTVLFKGVTAENVLL